MRRPNLVLIYNSVFRWYLGTTLVDTTTFWARPFQHLATFLTKTTMSTASVLFSLSSCLFDVIKFVLLSVFTLIETICLKICSKSRRCLNLKLPLRDGKPYDVQYNVRKIDVQACTKRVTATALVNIWFNFRLQLKTSIKSRTVDEQPGHQ